MRMSDWSSDVCSSDLYIERHSEECETLHFVAVSRSDSYPEDGSDENNTYAKFSPDGRLSLTVANPALIGKFTEGEEYYLDFIKAGRSEERRVGQEFVRQCRTRREPDHEKKKKK